MPIKIPKTRLEPNWEILKCIPLGKRVADVQRPNMCYAMPGVGLELTTWVRRAIHCANEADTTTLHRFTILYYAPASLTRQSRSPIPQGVSGTPILQLVENTQPELLQMVAIWHIVITDFKTNLKQGLRRSMIIFAWQMFLVHSMCYIYTFNIITHTVLVKSTKTPEAVAGWQWLNFRRR